MPDPELEIKGGGRLSRPLDKRGAGLPGPSPESATAMLSFYCRGVCMYRTVKTHDLILKGVPDSLRAEVWLIFSGAINQVICKM